MKLSIKPIVIGGSIFSILATEIHDRSNSVESPLSWWVTIRQIFNFKHQQDYIVWPGHGVMLSIDAALRIAEDLEDYNLMADLSKFQRKPVQHEA